jgi:hypothetical protein
MVGGAESERCAIIHLCMEHEFSFASLLPDGPPAGALRFTEGEPSMANGERCDGHRAARSRTVGSRADRLPGLGWFCRKSWVTAEQRRAQNESQPANE